MQTTLRAGEQEDEAGGPALYASVIALLDDARGFGDWLAALPKDGYRQLPDLLRYLLFPDEDERISLADHKHRILSAIAPDLVPEDE